jgi:hypothetical protein
MAQSMIQNLLPQDTRTSEICAGVVLVSMALLCFLGMVIDGYPIDMGNLSGVQVMPFWAMSCLVMGLMQLLSVAIYPRAELLRVIMSWANGSALIWLGLTASIGHVDPSDLCAFFVGVSNLYAFIINASLLRKSWVM